MHITFVALGCEQMGISLLSAIAKREGYEVSLAFSASLFNDRYNLSIPTLAPFFDDRDEVIKTIKRNKPDVLAFSALTGTYQWMLSIAKEAKEIFPNIKTILGGVHVSAVPERVLAQPQVDYVCVGEGDMAFPMILDAIKKKKEQAPIPNTRFKLSNGEIIKGPQTGFIQDLDSLPYFDKTIWEEHIRVGDLYFTMASRGCPYRCTFCFNNFFAKLPQEKSGKYVRQRSVEHMMEELRIAKKRYKLRMIEFEDDVFTVDKSWLKKFLHLYKKEINVPFQCLTHPKYMDEEVAKWMAKAGCIAVQMGIQTMDDEFKFQSIRRYEKSHHVEKALEVMRKYNLRPKVDHMFGLPGEPLEAQETARKLYITQPPYRIQTFWTNFLPGTEMVEQGRKMGLITSEEIERLNDGLGFDFYRSTTRIEDPQKLKTYKAYEVLFKLIPILPKTVRYKIHPNIFKRLPLRVCSFISFFIDAFVGLIKKNPDHIAYVKHYSYHIIRFVLRKLGLKFPTATPIKKEVDNNLTFLNNPPLAKSLTKW